MALSTKFEFSNIDSYNEFINKNKNLTDDISCFCNNDKKHISIEWYNIEFINDTLNFYKNDVIVYITESTSDYINHNITKMIYKNEKIEEIDYLEELYSNAKTQKDYLNLIRYNGKYYELTPEEYKKNPNFMLKVFNNWFIDEFYSRDEFNTNDLLINKDFLISIVKRYDKKLYNDSLLDDDEKIIKLFSWYNLPDKLFQDKTFLKKALNIDYKKYFHYLDIKEQKLKIEENIELIDYADKNIYRDDEFLNKIGFNEYFVERYQKNDNIPIDMITRFNKDRFLAILKTDFLNKEFNKDLLKIYDIKKNLYNSIYIDQDNKLFDKDYINGNDKEIEFYLSKMLKFESENDSLLLCLEPMFLNFDNEQKKFSIRYGYNKFIAYLFVLPDDDIKYILELYKQFILDYFNLISCNEVEMLKKQILKVIDSGDDRDKRYFFEQIIYKRMLLNQILGITDIVNDKDFIYELLVRYYDSCNQENDKTIDYLLSAQENINSLSELSSGINYIDKYRVLSTYNHYEFLIQIKENNEIKLNSIIMIIGNYLLDDTIAMNEMFERYFNFILPF